MSTMQFNAFTVSMAQGEDFTIQGIRGSRL